MHESSDSRQSEIRYDVARARSKKKLLQIWKVTTNKKSNQIDTRVMLYDRLKTIMERES